MNIRMIRIGVEIALVLGTAGLALEIVQSHPWAFLFIIVAGIAWFRIRNRRSL